MTILDRTFGLLFLIMAVTFALMAFSSRSNLTRILGLLLAAVAAFVGVWYTITIMTMPAGVAK